MWCGHCSALLSVTLRPALVHESSDVLGYIDSTNCRAVDCTAALLLASCLECFNTLRLPPFVRNRRLERTCNGVTCHAKVAFKAARLQLEEVTPPKQEGNAESKEEDPLEKDLAAFRNKVTQVAYSIKNDEICIRNDES